MSGDSDGEGSVGHEADFVDATADTEVDLRLPLEVDMKPVQLQEDVPAYSGAVDLSTVDLGQEERRRFEPTNGAKYKWPRHGLPLPIITAPRSPVPGTMTHLIGSGAGRHRLERQTQRTWDLPSADRMLGLRHPLGCSSEGFRDSRAQVDSCRE